MDTTTDDNRPERPLLRRQAVRAAVGVVIGAAAALVLLLLATASGQALTVQAGTRPPQELGAGAIVSVVLLSGAAAWGAAAVATRWAPRPRSAFVAAAGLGLVVSLVPPATAATGATTWWLDAMHLVVFASLLASLAPAIPSRSATRRAPLEARTSGGVA
jgi:uncharacterized protein DUF6069